MVSLAKIYEGADAADASREYAFREWVADEEFDCERCKARFRATADVRSEYDQVLCQKCAKECK